MLLKRIIADSFLFILVLSAPWWFFLPLALFFSFYFEHYYEAMASGLVFDLIYGAPLRLFFSFSFVFTCTMSALFFIVESAKPHLKFYL